MTREPNSILSITGTEIEAEQLANALHGTVRQDVQTEPGDFQIEFHDPGTFPLECTMIELIQAVRADHAS